MEFSSARRQMPSSFPFGEVVNKSPVFAQGRPRAQVLASRPIVFAGFTAGLKSRPFKAKAYSDLSLWLISLEINGELAGARTQDQRLKKGKCRNLPYKSDLSGVYRYRYAKQRGKVDFNPVRDARQFTVKQTVPRWLRNEEESALRAILQRWIDECPVQYRQRRLVLRCHPYELTLALGTGMRAGNLYGLRWENFDFDARRINLVRTKNGNPQTISMIDDVFIALKALLSVQTELRQIQKEAISKKGEDHQVRMPIDGKVILWAAPHKWWLAALAEAKITDLRWHDLRHTFATRLMMHTGNLKIVQEACGHANITMTARYAPVSQTDLAEAMSSLNRL
jgi:integrase